MKRFLAIIAIAGLLLLTASPAKATPSELGVCEPTPVLGLQLCVRIDGNEAITTVIDGAGDIVDSVVAPVQTIVERVEVPVIVPGPAPAPATVTRTVTPPRATVTQAPETVTVTEEGATITETAPPASVTPTPTNGPVGQDRDESDRLDDESTPTLAVPPSDNEPGPIFDFVPDDPEVAAATFSIVGFIAGIILGIIGLIMAYKRGKTDGEQATMDEFLGTLHPTGPKHRA